MSESHQRKCWDCGNVAEHADSVVPHVLCKLCGSQDTRRIRTPEPIAFRQLPPTPENLQRIGWGYWNHTAHMRTNRSPIGHRLVAYREYWRLELGFNAVDKIPVPATMGDVLDLCRLLGIPCEVIS